MSNFRMLFMGGIACLTLVTLTAVYLAGLSAGKSKIQRQWDRERIAQMQALASQEAAHRAKEKEWGEATTLLWASLRDAQEALQDDYEAAIADMQSGNLRLRNDLRGCRAQLPSDSLAATGDNAAGESGLSTARQGVALRIGADCDAVALRLTAAQEYIKAIRSSETGR
jgi:hypothetical protein